MVPYGTDPSFFSRRGLWRGAWIRLWWTGKRLPQWCRSASTEASKARWSEKEVKPGSPRASKRSAKATTIKILQTSLPSINYTTQTSKKFTLTWWRDTFNSGTGTELCWTWDSEIRMFPNSVPVPELGNQVSRHLIIWKLNVLGIRIRKKRKVTLLAPSCVEFMWGSQGV